MRISHENKAGFMFDTVAFNRALTTDDSVNVLSNRVHMKIYATHVQRDEINNTPGLDLRSKLNEAFVRLGPTIICTNSAAWEVSEWGQGGWGDDDDLYERYYSDLRRCDESKKNRRRRAQDKIANNLARDVLIAETAIKQGLTLVTDDKCLAKITRQYGGDAISFSELMIACQE